MLRLLSFCLVCLLPAIIHADEKPLVIIDTDLGNDVDDALALRLAVSKDINVIGITTVGATAEQRAWMASRYFWTEWKGKVPICWGRDPQPKRKIEGLLQYRRHPALIFNRMGKPAKEKAVDFLYQSLKNHQGKITLVCLGPLTNVAKLIKARPECKPWFQRVIISGTKQNFELDPTAGQTVLESRIPLVVLPPSFASALKLNGAQRTKYFSRGDHYSLQAQAMFQMSEGADPCLMDALAVLLASSEKYCKTVDARLGVTDSGAVQTIRGKPNAKVVNQVRSKEFVADHFGNPSGEFQLKPVKQPNVTKPIPNDNMPTRVHAFEDFETDIERRWWMAGKAETKNVPKGSSRACRGILTQDFDGKMGDLRTLYNAVIFNPVPGPPMGKKPRLRFRCWLNGTSTLRVQIYSLSNGYHRSLTLHDVPQKKWQELTVDMTHARRPDGTGGPLSENERIDDIQFYVDPRAELLIDDIVLYDAPMKDEKRAFPKRIQFTGWFDTGRQGREWPGDYKILDHKGVFWDAAQSVPMKNGKGEWIRLDLRGERPLDEKPRLFFRYRVKGTKSMDVILSNRTTKKNHVVKLENLTEDKWTETTVNFDASGPHKAETSDEIQFLIPKDAELLIDDVLLYSPGSGK